MKKFLLLSVIFFFCSNPVAIQESESLFELRDIYPNPFKELTEISIVLLDGSAFLTLKIYNSLGEEVCILEEDSYYSCISKKQLDWIFNPKEFHLPQGIYLCKIIAKKGSLEQSLSKRITYIK